MLTAPMWTDAFAAILRRDVLLAEMTTIRLGGRARCLVEPRNDEEVGDLLGALAAAGIAWKVIGGGSNLLPPDEDVDEVVIHPARLDSLAIDGEFVTVGAGLPLSALVARASEASLAGVHVLAGIPGQVGGALAMNAGGRHGEIAEVVDSVRVRLADGRSGELAKRDLDFGYRRCRLPEDAVITSARLRLRPAPDPRELKRETGRILKEKNAAQPTTGWNFGCMFKNPAGGSAGKLLDAAGLKGLSRGGARISPKHANFVENLGTATAADVRFLIEEAERRVSEALGVRLEREVRIWK